MTNNNGINEVDGYIPTEELRRKAQVFYLDDCAAAMRRREKMTYLADVATAFFMGAAFALLAWLMFGGF